MIKGGRYLYAFRSAKKANAEEASYLARREKHKDFTPEGYAKKKELFGVIVFESDQDLDPETAYLCYDERWLLELVFNRYKNDVQPIQAPLYVHPKLRQTFYLKPHKSTAYMTAIRAKTRRQNSSQKLLMRMQLKRALSLWTQPPWLCA